MLLGEVLPDLAGQDPYALSLADAAELRAIVQLDGETPGMLTRDQYNAAGEDVAEEMIETLQQRVRVRDIAMLMYTSGTTAKPKGCLLTHESLVRHGGNVARNRFFLTVEDRYWDPLPLFHIGGIVPMLSCFVMSARPSSTPVTSIPTSRSSNWRSTAARSPIRPSRRCGFRCSTIRASTRRTSAA